MILLGGLRTDPCLRAVECELSRDDVPVAWFDQEEWARARASATIESSGLVASLELADCNLDLGDLTGVYLRLVDFRRLASLGSAAPGSGAWRSCHAVHEVVRALAEASSARVVTRSRSEGSNFSKPYQTLVLSRLGLRVPDTLITNCPEEARAFIREHGSVVYKSASAVRSIVQVMNADSEDRLGSIRTCPVQFQALISGRDIRVHVVDGQLFATAIDSSVIDYRYAGQADTPTTFAPIVLDPTIADAVRNACLALELPVAGVDLKVDAAGQTWCLEVNTNPGFSWFEEATQQPIARSVALYLRGL